ncbi:exonuclease SbcCD subunit D [Vibrio sp. SM6]|uniref:Nuclease SbcCD subunit D n=1 Tax=Vibrio agarilyticus TaxID=2726741 RepID=A0A7X8YHC0_9VIBR|nr:exonuclease SbcCD subunit D [Vibrio agarilyticus]NLS13420.1 exonuclease SbcCD subunit D [Vibrio agarilyticus]
MKFIHTSDWHLGRQFHGVSLIDDQAAVLSQLIDYLKQHPVDALIVAGDIYDRSVPPTKAIELLNHVVDEVCGALNIPMILIPGNHDGAERLAFAASQLKASGLYIIGSFDAMTKPVILRSDTVGEVAFFGIPYADPEQVRHHFSERVSDFDSAHQVLVEQIIAQRDSSMRNVLISHCFVDGAIDSDSERPLSIGGSDRVSHEHFLSFDYVALGHLHQPQYKGAEHIRYSGSLMKYSFSEQHQRKGVTLVELTKEGPVCIEHLDLRAPHEMRIIEGELARLLELGVSDPKREDYLLVRLTDKHAILNPMEKLREVYPNVLHLEKPGMLIGVENPMGQAKLARSEFEMFDDFFAQAQGDSLNDEQAQAVHQILKQLQK